MRKIIVLLAVIIALMFWSLNFVKSGKFERYLDNHPNEALNSSIEYYWTLTLELAGRVDSAKYRYQRIMEKYPDTEYAPLAWFALIEGMDEGGSRGLVLDECNKFIEKYPTHPKSDVLRKKITFIQGNS